MKNKGLALIPSDFLTLLVTAVLITFVFVIGISNYFDVRTVVREYRTDRHALDVAQALLSSEKLAYYDGIHFNRGVFEKQKLDDVLKTDSELVAPFVSKGKLDIAYPNSVMIVAVADLESEPPRQMWMDTVYGTITYEGLSALDWTNCLFNKANFVEEIFKVPVGPWDIWSLQKCIPMFATIVSPFTGEKIEGIWASNIPVATRGFPVAIKDGDIVHLGAMKVWLIEL